MGGRSVVVLKCDGDAERVDEEGPFGGEGGGGGVLMVLVAMIVIMIEERRTEKQESRKKIQQRFESVSGLLCRRSSITTTTTTTIMIRTKSFCAANLKITMQIQRRLRLKREILQRPFWRINVS